MIGRDFRLGGIPLGGREGDFMLTHAQVWSAIDRLAARAGLSASGSPGVRVSIRRRSTNRSASRRKAARAGPRPNRSPRRSPPPARRSTPSSGCIATAARRRRRGGAALGFAEAGAGGYFDDGGFPAGEGWDEIAFPAVNDEHAYALEVSGQSMEPAYRDGDVVVVSPAAPIRRGDRVVVRTRDGEVMAKELKRRTAKSIELKSLNAAHADRTLAAADVLWIARILWASQ